LTVGFAEEPAGPGAALLERGARALAGGPAARGAARPRSISTAVRVAV